MQKLTIFAVRDTKVNAYGTPFFAPNEPSAVRSFTQLANDKQTTVGQFPNDFDLFEVGSFEVETGVITPLETPRHLQKAAHLLSDI